MADLPPGVIPVSADEFDRLYPVYELEAQPGTEVPGMAQGAPQGIGQKTHASRSYIPQRSQHEIQKEACGH